MLRTLVVILHLIVVGDVGGIKLDEAPLDVRLKRDDALVLLSLGVHLLHRRIYLPIPQRFLEFLLHIALCLRRLEAYLLNREKLQPFYDRLEKLVGQQLVYLDALKLVLLPRQ